MAVSDFVRKQNAAEILETPIEFIGVARGKEENDCGSGQKIVLTILLRRQMR